MNEADGLSVDGEAGGGGTEAGQDGGSPLGDAEDLEGAPGKQSTSSYLKEHFFSFFQPSDNKLAMKLFGNRNALIRERQRQKQQGKWVIHPCSNFR